MEGFDEIDLDGIDLENLDLGGNRDGHPDRHWHLDIDAEMTVKGVAKCLQQVKTLSNTQKSYLLASPFGHFLEIPPRWRCITYACHDRLRFEVDGHLLEYGESEFILISGLRYFLRLVIKKLHLNDFSNLIESARFKEINHEDASLVVQIFILLRGFMGRDLCTGIPPSVLTLADDINSWNRFAWGTYLWEYTYVQMSHIFKTIAEYVKDFYDMGTDKHLKYTVVGFMFPFKIWIWETFPIIRVRYAEYKGEDVLPRMKAWKRKRRMEWIHIKDILNISLVMIPRQNELNTDYYSHYIRWKEGNRSPQMQHPRPKEESEHEKDSDEQAVKNKWRTGDSSSSATSSSRAIRRKTSKKNEKLDEVLKSVKYLTNEMLQMKSQLSSLELQKKAKNYFFFSVARTTYKSDYYVLFHHIYHIL
ncbi:hypothetical protein LXL04_024933 [Taraxacum kok-saghyz]